MRGHRIPCLMEHEDAYQPGREFFMRTRLPALGWAAEGTPVDVVPGKGQPVAEQLSE